MQNMFGLIAALSISSTLAAEGSEAAALQFPEIHPEASQLNRYNFAGNVLLGTGDHVKHWVVIFCTEWHEKCRGLVPSFELLGAQWEEKLNSGDLFGSSVRFAKVDCATDKELCNSEDVEDYPTAMHYQHGQRMGRWAGGAPGLVRWVKQELTGTRAKQSSHVQRGQGISKRVASEHSASCVARESPTHCSASKHDGVPQAASQQFSAPNVQMSTILLGLLLIMGVGVGVWHFSTP